METLKYYAKVAAIRTVVLTLSVFYSSLVAVGILVKWAIKGKEYWYVKERTLPPLILQDSSWGRHSYVNLKVCFMTFRNFDHVIKFFHSGR